VTTLGLLPRFSPSRYLIVPTLTPSNARTAHFKPDLPIPTLITINPDRTFSFTFRTPPVSYLLKKAAGGIEKGSGASGQTKVGTVSLKHVYEIAKIKASEDGMKHLGEERIARTVIGSARSMGIEVVP
jgi:large subunit ribosomal protein L11